MPGLRAASLSFEHEDQGIAGTLLMEAMGTADFEFVDVPAKSKGLGVPRSHQRGRAVRGSSRITALVSLAKSVGAPGASVAVSAASSRSTPLLDHRRLALVECTDVPARRIPAAAQEFLSGIPASPGRSDDKRAATLAAGRCASEALLQMSHVLFANLVGLR